MTNKLPAVLAVLAGCAAESDGAFHVVGRLADPSAVTHVIAWNADSGERIAIDLKADGLPDGELDIALAPGGGWGITFANAERSGAAMRVATLRVGELDTLWPQAAGLVDLQTITFSDATATGTTAAADIVAALGLSAEAAEDIGRTDDLALRYSNPDVDDDGVLDAVQGHAYTLGFGARFRLQHANRDLEVADLVRATTPSGLRLLGTDIIVGAPHGVSVSGATFQFDESFYGTALGPDTAAVPARTPIGAPHVRFGSEGSRIVGLVASPERDIPRGSYQIDLADRTLTFSDVRPPRTTMLEAASAHAVPLLRVRPTTADCAHDCSIAALDLSWWRASAFGWMAAPAPLDARIDVVALLHGKRVVLAADLRDAASSVAWQDMSTKGAGMLYHELAYISSADLCYIAVSYQSELGMQMTSQTTNPACAHGGSPLD